jgi:hypothetical protein
MSRIKVMLLAGLAVMAASAVASSSALAEWLVNGTVLTGSAAIASLPLIDSSPILHLPQAGIAILCESLHLFGGRILPPDLIYIEKIVFLHCHTIAPTPTKCQLNPTEATIESTALLGLATLTRILNGKPESGKQFTSIPFSEEFCAIPGVTPVKGEVTLGATDANTDKAEHLVTGLGSVENNSLEVGSGNKGFLLGAILVGLAGNPTWAFH